LQHLLFIIETILWDANPFRKKLWLADICCGAKMLINASVFLGEKKQKMPSANVEDEVKSNGGLEKW
jgi:hypothetical protein